MRIRFVYFDVLVFTPNFTVRPYGVSLTNSIGVVLISIYSVIWFWSLYPAVFQTPIYHNMNKISKLKLMCYNPSSTHILWIYEKKNFQAHRALPSILPCTQPYWRQADKLSAKNN